MAADLIASLTSQLAAADVSDVTGGTPVTASLNVFAHKGCQRLHKLLTTLAETFPENAKLAMWLTVYETTILDKPEMEAWAMEKWHDEMTNTPDGKPREVSLYQKTRERDIEALLSSGVWVLDEIDARSMYFDDGLEEDDQEEIAIHFDQVNACSQWMCTIPKDILERVMETALTVDRTQALTPETMFAMMQKTLGLGEGEGDGQTDAAERIVGWTSQVMQMITTGGLESLLSIAGGNASLAAAGMPDLATLMSSLSSELLGTASVLEAAGVDDGANVGQMETMKAVLSSILGAPVGSK